MCAADRAVKLDVDEAFACGRQAVRLAEKGENGVMVTIERTFPEYVEPLIGELPTYSNLTIRRAKP